MLLKPVKASWCGSWVCSVFMAEAVTKTVSVWGMSFETWTILLSICQKAFGINLCFVWLFLMECVPKHKINAWCHPCWPELAGPCWKLLTAGIFCSYRHYPALGGGPANVSRHSFIMFSSAYPSVGQIRRIIQCYAKREDYSLALQNIRSWPVPINIRWDSPINQPFITDARLIGYHEL